MVLCNSLVHKEAHKPYICGRLFGLGVVCGSDILAPKAMDRNSIKLCCGSTGDILRFSRVGASGLTPKIQEEGQKVLITKEPELHHPGKVCFQGGKGEKG